MIRSRVVASPAPASASGHVALRGCTSVSGHVALPGGTSVRDPARDAGAAPHERSRELVLPRSSGRGCESGTSTSRELSSLMPGVDDTAASTSASSLLPRRDFEVHASSSRPLASQVGAQGSSASVVHALDTAAPASEVGSSLPLLRREVSRHFRRSFDAPALPCVLFFSLALGCGAPATGVRAEPGSLVFTPAAERLELRLVNHGEASVPLTRIRFDTRTPDWGAFTIENREYPREIAAGGAVSLRLRVDRDHFARAGALRSGSARLLFAAGEAPQIVELRYEPPDLASDLLRAAIRTALMLALVALAWLSTRRTRLPWTAWLPVLAVLALFPLGPGLCLDSLGRSLSAADVEQCAAGRGGAPLSLLAVGEGWLLYLLALVLAGLGRLVDRAALARRLASRDLALAAAFAGPLLAFSTLDPRQLVGEQAAGLLGGGAAIPPAWGIFVQPIAAAVALAVAAAPPASRLERLAFAAAFVACFLGGGWPAAALAGGHGLVLFIGAVVAAVKIAAVVWFVQRLHASATGSRARAALFFLERAAMPLAIANLLMTSAYALLR